MLNMIAEKIKVEFEPLFTNADSVMVFRFNQREVLRFGNALHKKESLLVL